MKELHAQFSDLVQKLSDLSLAYLHVVEPRISGGTTVKAAEEDNTFLFDAFGDTGAMVLAVGSRRSPQRKRSKPIPVTG